MADKMTNGDITAQPATGQEPDANDQLAIDPTQVGDTEGQAAADPAAPVVEPMIPKSRLDEESAKAVAAAQEAALLRQQILLMQTAQQYAPQYAPTPTAPPAPVNPYEDLDDDDYVNVGAARQREQALSQQIQRQVDKQIQVGLFQARHQDYNEVVGAVNPATGQFQYSQHLTAALTKNPVMAQILQQQTDPLQAMQLGYDLAAKERAASIPIPTAPNAAHLRQNALNTASAQTNPMPGSAVGGSGEVNSEVSVSAMDAAAFAELDRQVMSGKFG